MSLLTPLALIGLALTIPILLLYMLRLRRREIVISSTFLWSQVLQDREANTPWQKLRRNFLLLLQLLILLLLVLALARPFIIVPAVSAGQIALLIDASASMNATDSAVGTRFDDAKARALEIVETMGADDAMTVIRVAGVPEVLTAYTADRAALRTAIQNAAPSFARADWNAALTLAAAGALAADDFSAVIISDGGIGDAARLPAIPGTLSYIPVGTSAENVAITALATRALPGDAPQLFAQITNYGTTDADVIFSLRADGELFMGEEYTIPAGGTVAPDISSLPESYTALEAALTISADSAYVDQLVSDNSAWTIGGASGARRVLLLTSGNLFLEQVLRILPGLQTFVGDPARPLPAQTFDVTVLDGFVPAQLPNGDLLVINPPSGYNGLFSVGAEQESVSNIRVSDDPRMALVDFADVNIRAFKPTTADWAQPLIEADGGTLLIAGDIADRQVAVLTFNLADSDLPLQITFPVLIASLMDWYRPPSALADQTALHVGDGLTIRLAGDQDAARVIAPDGLTRDLSGVGAERYFGATDAPGLYLLELLTGGDVTETAAFAVNGFDAGESDITPRAEITLGSTVVGRVEESDEFGQQEFWSWLALLALVILLIEWWAYHRRDNVPTILRSFRREAARA